MHKEVRAKRYLQKLTWGLKSGSWTTLYYVFPTTTRSTPAVAPHRWWTFSCLRTWTVQASVQVLVKAASWCLEATREKKSEKVQERLYPLTAYLSTVFYLPAKSTRLVTAHCEYRALTTGCVCYVRRVAWKFFWLEIQFDWISRPWTLQLHCQIGKTPAHAKKLFFFHFPPPPLKKEVHPLRGA